MIICKCDRCKNIIPFASYQKQKYDIYRNKTCITLDSNIIEGEETIHFCPECTEAFDKFLNGEAIKPYLFGNHVESVTVDEFIGPMGGFKDANVNTN